MSAYLVARIAALSLAFPSALLAGECQPAGMNGLTARLVNPTGRVSGEVDASGCDIGVYYDRATGSVENAEIRGARFAAVFVSGDARVGVEAVSVHGLGAAAAGVVFQGSSGSVVESSIDVRSERAIVALGRTARVIAIGNRLAPGAKVVALAGATISARRNVVLPVVLHAANRGRGERPDDGITIEPVSEAVAAEADAAGIDLLELLSQQVVEHQE